MRSQTYFPGRFTAVLDPMLMITPCDMFQIRQSIVRHAVVVHQVAIQRGQVLGRVSLLEANFVIHASGCLRVRLLDQYADGLLDRQCAVFGLSTSR